eukprot:TRINITY_DN19371_c0_g1_i1.p1 TRINITY_DN19371_c0_g1~~TRINITY_DN19371_c0_g1_i1.p1  ORF type:complete len:128 (-),score=12.51 TRINITY_DN19371_c0_g1_i1:417-800(-)
MRMSPGAGRLFRFPRYNDYDKSSLVETALVECFQEMLPPQPHRRADIVIGVRGIARLQEQRRAHAVERRRLLASAPAPEFNVAPPLVPRSASVPAHIRRGMKLRQQTSSSTSTVATCSSTLSPESES